MKNLLVATVVAFSATFIPTNSYGNKNNVNKIIRDVLELSLEQGKNQPGKTQGGQKTGKTQDNQQPKQQQKQQDQPKQQPNKNQQPKQQDQPKQQNKQQPQRENSNKNQGNKSEKGNKQDNNKDIFKGNKKENRNDKNYPSNFKNNKAQKHNFKHPYKFGPKGVWYSYGNNQGFYYSKNYGQWRSAQARNKHNQFQPRYEYEAIGAYLILVDRNVFLFNQTDSKIIFVRSRLLERRNAGLITVVEYETNLRTIEVIERRRAAIEVNIVI